MNENMTHYDEETGNLFEAVEGRRFPSSPRENAEAVRYRIQRMQERGVLIKPFVREQVIDNVEEA